MAIKPMLETDTTNIPKHANGFNAMKHTLKKISKPTQGLFVCFLLLVPSVAFLGPVHAATSSSTLILSETGQVPGEGLIPGMSTSYYDLAVSNEVFNGLAMRNDTVQKTMLPALANGTVQSPGWSVSADNKVWTVKLRHGVTWHDGVAFNATDVKFTFDSLQDPSLAAPVEAFVEGIVGGKNNVTIVDPYTVKFTLPVPYAYFVENILTSGIVPWHILKDVPYNATTPGQIDWRHSTFNTGQGSGQGPIGTGPYKWVGYDTTTATVHLTRNDNYFDFPSRGKSDLIAKGGFTIKDYYVKTIIGTDSAITAIKNGEVNVLDSQYHMETVPSFLSDWGSSNLAIYDAFGVQEMGVNMEHPILGTGTATPNGMNDPLHAAAYARFVRQAISYAIPRSSIITQLLNGYGNPAITTPVVGNANTGAALTEGFNTNLQPYPYNLTKAKQMLQAAGYTLPTQPGGCYTPQPATCLSPNLHFVLLVPTSNSARRAWAALIQSQLVSIGMDVGKVELPFSPNIYDRALTPPVSNLGKTYDQGGFDILFVGYNLGIDADPWSLYDSSQFAPTGGNYYLYSNSTNDNLVETIKSTVDKPTRLDLVKQWQVLAYNELPSIPILYTREIVAFDKTVINGQAVFQAYTGPAWPPVELLNVGQAAAPTNFFGAYGIYVYIAIAAVIVIAGGLLLWSRRRTVKPAVYTPPTTTPTSPSSQPPP